MGEGFGDAVITQDASGSISATRMVAAGGHAQSRGSIQGVAAERSAEAGRLARRSTGS